MGDQWPRLGHESLQNNFILTWNMAVVWTTILTS